MREIVRIARRPVMRVLAGEIVGVFAHVERADENRAGRLQALRPASRRRCAGGRSRLIFEPARVGSPFTSNRFFTANGAPASGPSGSPFARARVERVGAGKRALRRHVGEGAELRIALGDARQRRLDHGARGDLAGAARRRRSTPRNRRAALSIMA